MPQKLVAHQDTDAKVQDALQRMLKEMPDVKPVTASPAGNGFLSKYFFPKGAIASANPLTGNITYNEDQLIGRPQNEIDNTIAHELTHSRQSQLMPWYQKLATIPAAVGEMFGMDEKVPEQIDKNSPLNTPYAWRPRELEAFQTERDRTMNKKLPDIYTDPMTGARDIPLFPERKTGINVGPSKKVK